MWNGVANKSDIARGVAKSKVIAFPSGKLLAEPKIPSGSSLFRATDPGFVIIRHFGEKTIFAFKGDEFVVGTRSSNRSAATQLSTALVIISNTLALDVLGRFYVAESAEDEVGLYEIGKGLQARIALHKK